MDPEEVVQRFCALVSERDPALLRPLLSDDVIYHNVGLPPSVGIEATLANLANQWAKFAGAYEFDVRALAQSGHRVFTERVDTVGPTGISARVPLMGIFEVHAGRITAWRDYYSPTLVQALLSGEDCSDRVP